MHFNQRNHLIDNQSIPISFKIGACLNVQVAKPLCFRQQFSRRGKLFLSNLTVVPLNCSDLHSISDVFSNSFCECFCHGKTTLGSQVSEIISLRTPKCARQVRPLGITMPLCQGLAWAFPVKLKRWKLQPSQCTPQTISSHLQAAFVFLGQLRVDARPRHSKPYLPLLLLPGRV